MTNLQAIIDTVTAETGVTRAEIAGPSKPDRVIRARELIVYLARTHLETGGGGGGQDSSTPGSFPAIARGMGKPGRHSTAMATWQRAEKRWLTDSRFRAAIDRLEIALGVRVREGAAAA